MMKTCSACGESKPEESFPNRKSSKDGLNHRCQNCLYEYLKTWRSKNPAKCKKHAKTNRVNNALTRKIYNLKYAQRTGFRCQKNWAKKHPESIRAIRRKFLTKKRTDPIFRLHKSLYGRIRDVMSGRTKSAKTMELIGCSIDQAREWIEAQFKPGMTWQNYGTMGWHVDHIRPCASFDLSEPSQQRECFHFSNLQPLWWDENIDKADSFNGGQPLAMAA